MTLKCSILLLKELPAPFQGQGTPVAYLLDEHGRVAAPFASGTDRVLELAVRQSALERTWGKGSMAQQAFQRAVAVGKPNRAQWFKDRTSSAPPSRHALYCGKIGRLKLILRDVIQYKVNQGSCYKTTPMP
jgi:hypothetical protein